MIIFYNPRATMPKNRRFPLSILALAAVLEGREEYAIVDGNLDPYPLQTLMDLFSRNRVELLAVTVMPGPQLAPAIQASRQARRAFPAVPIVWGGYFPSIYTDAALNADYVDFAVRGQGEDTLLELLEALRGQRPLEGVRGLSFKDAAGKHHHNSETAYEGSGRVSVVSLSSASGRGVRPSFIFRPSHGSAPCQHRMSVQLQLLRDCSCLRKRREDGIARPD